MRLRNIFESLDDKDEFFASCWCSEYGYDQKFHADHLVAEEIVNHSLRIPDLPPGQALDDEYDARWNKAFDNEMHKLGYKPFRGEDGMVRWIR